MARSRVGATGLWQFMYPTGKMNGLSVNSYIDERNDPLKSTEAACLYLTHLYRIFDDWNLALAAYNSGPGNVNKAIRRSGGKKDYWAIRPFLPRETASYVPAFIAVNYIMTYYEEHLIYPTQLKPSFFSTDTVNIKERISFEQITTLIDISEEELEFLNPAYRHKLIPKKSKGHYPLVLPQDKIGLFVSNEDSIYKIAAQHFEENKASVPAETPLNDRVRHRVHRGEVLGTIAEKYGVSVRNIRDWNGLRGNTIRLGQRLTIYPRRMPSQKTATHTAKKSSPKKSSPNKSGEYESYRVRNGETFYSIAKKYPGISAQNIMAWNGINNARRLKPGMTLKIYRES
jgi:membrane-bound lytic murein transglycosylase D